eukprot:scaffold9890_cov21-Cyclotella_meneghiniana.AAC.1
MIIPIRPPSDTTLQNQCGGKSIQDVEWVMIELNGELLKPSLLENDDNDDNETKQHNTLDRRHFELGSVKFDSNGAPTIIIGHHQLKGTTVNLKEPFAVLRKRKFQPEEGEGTKNNDTYESKLLKRHEGVKVQYEVAGI